MKKPFGCQQAINGYMAGALLSSVLSFLPLTYVIKQMRPVSDGYDVAAGLGLIGLIIPVSFIFGLLGVYIVWRRSQ